MDISKPAHTQTHTQTLADQSEPSQSHYVHTRRCQLKGKLYPQFIDVVVVVFFSIVFEFSRAQDFLLQPFQKQEIELKR